MISLTVALALASLGSASVIDKRQATTVTVTATATTSTVPDYFQATPAIFEGTFPSLLLCLAVTLN